MTATFVKVTISGTLSYVPVTSIKRVVVNDASQPQVKLMLHEGQGDYLLYGEEAIGVLAILEQLSQAPARRSRRGLI